MNHISLKIPAYSSEKTGMIIELSLRVNCMNSFKITTEGNIASALQKNFHRVIAIMALLKSVWKCLFQYEYHLIGNDENLTVKDARSSSVAIAIALLKLTRVEVVDLNEQELIGTGILRIDGSIEQSQFEGEKHRSLTKSHGASKRFITSEDCNHLFKLDKIINTKKKTVSEIKKNANSFTTAGECQYGIS